MDIYSLYTSTTQPRLSNDFDEVLENGVVYCTHSDKELQSSQIDNIYAES